MVFFNNKYNYRHSVPNVSLVLVFFGCISLLSRLLTCFISNIQIAINGFIFTFIFYIFPCYNELHSYIFYCAGGSNEDSEEDSEEDSNEDSDEDLEEEDELAHIKKEHQRISKDIKDIKHELSEIDKADKLAERLPESVKHLNSHENFINEKYPKWRREDIREYLVDELKRLRGDRKEYESKISQAEESIGDTKESIGDAKESISGTKESVGDTKVDSLMGNKRKESPIEDTNPNRTKRKKSSNDDDSSGSSGPSATAGPTSDSSVQDTENHESRENNLSKIIDKLLAILLPAFETMLDILSNLF